MNLIMKMDLLFFLFIDIFLLCFDNFLVNLYESKELIFDLLN